MDYQIINKNDEIFVVTSPEDGWDCVRKTVYTGYTETELRKMLDEERGESTEDELFIHQIFNINQKNLNKC